MPDAAIIIPHYNDTVRLARCLAALMPQVSADIEVVVVDNGSTEPVGDICAPYPAVRLVTETRKGAAMARNCGVEHTTAPLLFFLDCDCVPATDWVATALACVDQGDVVGGTVTVFDETPAPRSGAEAFETVFAFDNKGYIENKGFSITANLLTRRDVFENVGPFRAGMSEDLDWCQRATAKSYRLVHQDNLRAAHPTRSDWAALSRKWHRLTVESWGLQTHTMSARLKWALKACAMPLSVIAHLPKVLRAPALNGPADRISAVTTLLRLRLARAGWMLRQACGKKI